MNQIIENVKSYCKKIIPWILALFSIRNDCMLQDYNIDHVCSIADFVIIPVTAIGGAGGI